MHAIHRLVLLMYDPFLLHMKVDKKNIVQNLKSLYQLPKDKSLLQFLQAELRNRNDVATGKLIDELFELHRTSHGFDPIILSKVRLRRMKPADYLQLLLAIDNQLQEIYETEEFKSLLNSSAAGYTQLLARLLNFQRKIEMGFINGIETEMAAFQKDLIAAGELELLLSLNKVCGNYFEQHNNSEKAGAYARDYNKILQHLSQN